jgi:hypothetical protein
VIDYWGILSGVLLVIVGAYNVWLSSSPHFEDNPVTVLLSRWLGGVGRTRTLILVLGVVCVLFGVVGIIFAVTGSNSTYPATAHIAILVYGEEPTVVRTF